MCCCGRCIRVCSAALDSRLKSLLQEDRTEVSSSWDVRLPHSPRGVAAKGDCPHLRTHTPAPLPSRPPSGRGNQLCLDAWEPSSETPGRPSALPSSRGQRVLALWVLSPPSSPPAQATALHVGLACGSQRPRQEAEWPWVPTSASPSAGPWACMAITAAGAGPSDPCCAKTLQRPSPPARPPRSPRPAAPATERPASRLVLKLLHQMLPSATPMAMIRRQQRPRGPE